MTGWYSAKQAALLGSWIYSTPSGEEMEVTVVTSEGAAPFSFDRFDDYESRGPVKAYLRRARNGASTTSST